jgi:hypothetical protein
MLGIPPFRNIKNKPYKDYIAKKAKAFFFSFDKLRTMERLKSC